MHMADALISPAVGGTMWAATVGAVVYSARKVDRDLDERKVPLMGVLGAFIFAAQMINFSIPGTGSSGHLAGALILSILLGSYAGFLTMASIITIQALFFADGGLLALGCNIFNMGFYTCFIAYPLIYKPLMRRKISPVRVFAGSLVASVLGLQLGAFSVVLQTVCSGISALPFKTFFLLMQPIHLAIGVVEGLVTTAVVTFVMQARPEILERSAVGEGLAGLDLKKVLIGLGIVALLMGGAVSWFASSNPDGLEWSMLHTSGQTELKLPDGIHKVLAKIQKKTAFLPEYGYKNIPARHQQDRADKTRQWLKVSGGTSFAGVIGGVLTLILAGCIGFILHLFKRKNA